MVPNGPCTPVGLLAQFGLALPAATRIGRLPPIVTVTVSTDVLPLAAVMTSWPHRAGAAPAPLTIGPPNWRCCCTAQVGKVWPAPSEKLTLPWIVPSTQLTVVSG